MSMGFKTIYKSPRIILDVNNRKNILLQMYLVITGIIPLPWEENATLKIKDLNGNLLYIPTTTVFSLAFSLFSMIKAIVYFNIARIHVGVS